MIKAVYESGYSQTVYNIFIALCFVGVILFALWYGGKYNLTKKKSFAAALGILIITYAWIFFYNWLESGFQRFGGKNLVHGFIYIPLFAWPIARILKTDWLRICDFFAPLPALAQGISKVGCTFAGCCRGYPSAFGIYNPLTERTTFPIQLVECVTYLTIAFGIAAYAKRKKYRVDGRAYALVLILFGTARFLFEFARDNRKLILGCSPLALHAAFMAIVGYGAMVFIAEWEKRQEEKKRTQRHHRKHSGKKRR